MCDIYVIRSGRRGGQPCVHPEKVEAKSRRSRQVCSRAGLAQLLGKAHDEGTPVPPPTPANWTRPPKASEGCSYPKEEDAQWEGWEERNFILKRSFQVCLCGQHICKTNVTSRSPFLIKILPSFLNITKNSLNYKVFHLTTRNKRFKRELFGLDKILM